MDKQVYSDEFKRAAVEQAASATPTACPFLLNRPHTPRRQICGEAGKIPMTAREEIG